MDYVNYQNSIVNVSNSLLKYYNILNKHDTLHCLDNILNKKKPKNIVLFLCDGLGSFNLDDHLKKNSFLREHKIGNISSVFPPTTTAATTSILTGLYPSEHNWIGWNRYFKDTNEVISLYLNRIKEDGSKPRIDVLQRDYMKYKTIVDLINEKGVDKAYYAYPFDLDNPCKDIFAVINRIEKICNNDDGNRRFIYAYIENPDKIMHYSGIYSKKVKSEIEIINQEIQLLADRLHDTLIIVVSDHGLVVNKKAIVLKRDMKKMYDMLARTTSIESRASSIKLKSDVLIKDFEKLFNKYLKNDFILLSRQDIIDKKLFGYCYNSHFYEAIGDYLIVAIGNKSIEYDDKFCNFKASHGGMTKKELTVPLIIVDCI